MRSISIVGIGRIGGALAIALSRAGFKIESLIHRDPTIAKTVAPLVSDDVKLEPVDSVWKIGSELVLITTTDPEIQATALRLADKIAPTATVLHTSGSLSSEVMSALRTDKRRIGSLHPLVSISDPIAGADKFEGVYCCVEGDEEAVELARDLARSLGCGTFSIDPEYKALYHAAAVTSAGHIVALIDLAIAMLVECGLDRGTAKEVLLPLVESSVANLRSQTPEEALTGTFARADAEALERHLSSFRGPLADRIREIYLLLGEQSVDLAELNSVKLEAIGKIRESISVAKRKPGC